MNSADNPIFVGTNRFSTKVVPITTKTIFGEPTFSNMTLMPTGPVNQISFEESNGDNLFVNTRGIRSFNAALQMRNRGDNAPFSKRVSKLFRGIVQGSVGTCAIKYDDYVLFGVNTVYGPAILVYDETLQTFVGLDIYEGIGQIKQFARSTFNNSDRLFFITTDNTIYEAFTGATETCKLYLGEFCSQDAASQFTPGWLRIVLLNPLETGSISVLPYIDRKPFITLSRTVSKGVDDTVTQDVPFNPGNGDGVQHFSWDLSRAGVGWKFGVLIQLTGDAEISHLGLTTQDTMPLNMAKQEAKEWNSRR
jgi:hypothetical protein